MNTRVTVLDSRIKRDIIDKALVEKIQSFRETGNFKTNLTDEDLKKNILKFNNTYSFA